MKTIKTILCLLAAALGLAFTSSAADSPKIKVLLITGDDVAPAHNWKEMAAATREVLEESGKFEVVVSEDPLILESKNALKNYDLIFLSRFHRTGTITDQAKENLLNFVKEGKGFAISHLSSASFKEWDEFKNLCGRYWVMGVSGHGPRSVFKANIKNHDHPITKALDDFETDDELYAKLQGSAKINVLVTAFSDWSNQTEPLAFTLEYGKGRVFHETFGHDARAIKNKPVATLIVRGCMWAATGKVEN